MIPAVTQKFSSFPEKLSLVGLSAHDQPIYDYKLYDIKSNPILITDFPVIFLNFMEIPAVYLAWRVHLTLLDYHYTHHAWQYYL